MEDINDDIRCWYDYRSQREHTTSILFFAKDNSRNKMTEEEATYTALGQQQALIPMIISHDI
jgi:hypothetical protein